jgi:glycosyltransferase involved in cell wall biosynthesis
MQRKLFEKLALKNLCVGEFLNKWYGTTADAVSYGASELKGVKNLKVAEKINRAVFIGRLDNDTNILAYIKAMKLMKTPLILDVYGDGNQLNEAKNFTDAHAMPVAYHGWTTNVEKVLADVDVAFCGGYLSILEAMQAGVLVAAIYSSPIKKDYLLMHPMAEQMIIAPNFVELAEAIDTLSLTQRLKMVKNARKWASVQTFDRLCDQYMEMWAV